MPYTDSRQGFSIAGARSLEDTLLLRLHFCLVGMMSDHLIISHLCTDWVIFSLYKNSRQGQARGVSDSWYQCHESIRRPPQISGPMFRVDSVTTIHQKDTGFFVVYLLLNPCCWRESPSKRKTPMLSCFVTRVLALSTHVPALACSSLTLQCFFPAWYEFW